MLFHEINDFYMLCDLVEMINFDDLIVNYCFDDGKNLILRIN